MNNNHISAVVSTSRELKSGKNKGEFNIEVSSTTGANSYIHLSGGERQIVDFAVGLSIAELANSQTKTSTNILVLDEPFVDLDKRNSESVVEYLKTLIDEGYKDTIFLVSNDDNIKGLIPNKIVLEKTNGISKVVQAS